MYIHKPDSLKDRRGTGSNLEMSSSSPSTSLLRDLYARMLLTRVVDEYSCALYEQGQVGFVASCCGHEAAQVASTICIEVGKDFTLPYYRDLGVVLTIGMTPYEVFRTYLQAHSRQTVGRDSVEPGEQMAFRQPRTHTISHWGYHKHNMVTGPGPVATQILHAAGIAFACKLRKAPVVTVAYCGDGATAEPDFLEGITFAAQHQLPVVFICEQDCSHSHTDISSLSPLLQNLTLPPGLEHCCIDGSDVITVYATMRAAMQYAREGRGPVLLEMCVHRTAPGQPYISHSSEEYPVDPLLRCQQLLEVQGMWDEQWATQLRTRIYAEVEQAMQDALRDAS
jgi:2-oxoisovalerate dehydrogenase E1 component alpha subunit